MTPMEAIVIKETVAEIGINLEIREKYQNFLIWFVTRGVNTTKTAVLTKYAKEFPNHNWGINAIRKQSNTELYNFIVELCNTKVVDAERTIEVLKDKVDLALLEPNQKLMLAPEADKLLKVLKSQVDYIKLSNLDRIEVENMINSGKLKTKKDIDTFIDIQAIRNNK